MSVSVWWHGRLKASQPFWRPELRTPANMRPRGNDIWPAAVRKQALRLDYMAWFHGVYLPPYLESGYYQDVPDALPKAPDSLLFFSQIRPFLFLMRTEAQTRAYKVIEETQFEGRWIKVVRSRNFIRLCEWREHSAAFELVTGIMVSSDIPPPSKENMMAVAQGVTVAITKLAHNRETMQRTIGKLDKID